MNNHTNMKALTHDRFGAPYLTANTNLGIENVLSGGQHDSLASMDYVVKSKKPNSIKDK